jgi:hypothetical protein
MDEIIAYCGLICEKCAIYLATREEDPKKKHELRAEIARIIKEIYKEQIKAEDVTDCDGCRIEGGRLFTGCQKCEIRKCARYNAIENCAHCDEYVCEKLKVIFATEQKAKERLDKIRTGLQK